MIIDSHPVTRLGIKSSLEAGWDFEELADGRGAVELLSSVGSFDIAIIEMRSPTNGVPSGPATIGALLRQQPGLAVIAHGGPVERHSIREALDAGASAYVSKRSEPALLRTAVDAVTSFRSFIDPSVADGAADPALTPRQREILQLIADGHSTETVARRLGLSAETVRTHAKAALPRLGARDRAHAVAIAMRSSLIS